MNTLKILHCADVHIGAAESFLGAGSDARRYETLMTFERIVDLAISRRVKLVAIAGDLFDCNTVEQRFAEAVLAKIAEASDIKFIFAAGNHDPLDSQSPFLNRTLPDNLYVLGAADECVVFEEMGLKVYGRSFGSTHLKGEERLSLAADSNYINILVQHGELKSDLNSDYNAITPAFVKNSGMDYIALGHVHKRTEIGRIGDTFFAYCGCPEGQGFDELDEKGVYLGEIGKGVCDLEFVPIAKRRHIHEKIDISACCENGEIATAIIDRLKEKQGENYRENLYKIELIGGISAETQIVLPELESRLSAELYFVKLRDNTEFTLDLEALSNEPTLKGVFVKKMLAKIASATDEEQRLYKKALNLGLKAFRSEVKYNED